MDKLEKAEPDRERSELANESDVSAADRALLETPGGEDIDKDDAEITLVEQDAGEIPATPRSELTDFRDPGTDNDTPDGLTQDEESIRRGAEEVPSGSKQSKDIPVFDRGGGPDRR
jgi:hypothetical protein